MQLGLNAYSEQKRETWETSEMFNISDPFLHNTSLKSHGLYSILQPTGRKHLKNKSDMLTALPFSFVLLWL